MSRRAGRALPIAATLASVIVVVGAAAGVAEAHHAWNEIDTTKSTTLAGTVRSLKWENPHASLVLDVVDGSTRADLTVLMSGLARMEARGVHGEMVAVGKRLTIVGSPARDEPHVVRANRVVSDGAEYVLY